MERPQYWRRLFLFFYSAFAVLSLVGLILISSKYLAAGGPDSSSYADFTGYYRSARIVLSSDRTRIYDRDLQLRYFNELAAARKSTEPIYSQNPPYFFVLLSPFALLPLKLSFTLWIVLSALSVFAALYLLMKRLPDAKPATAFVFAVTALISAPGWIGISVGQMSCFIAALTTLFVIGFMRRQDLLCGLALALTTTKLQYVFLLSAPLLAAGRWRAIAWGIVAEAALLSLSALVLGIDNVIKYPGLLFSAETTKDYQGVFPEYMISLRGVLSLAMDRHAALLSSTLIVFAGIIPIFLLWRQQRRFDSRETAAWAMSVTIILALLLSAHTHIYDDILLVIPAALTLPLLWRGSTVRGESGTADCSPGSGRKDYSTVYGIAAAVWQIMLLSFPVLSWVLFIVCNEFNVIKRTPFTFVNLLLTICGTACYFACIARHKNSSHVSTET
jgi:hypothetical protein